MHQTAPNSSIKLNKNGAFTLRRGAPASLESCRRFDSGSSHLSQLGEKEPFANGESGHAPKNAPRPTLSERFWKFVTKGGAEECWPWTGRTDKDGYGKFSVGDKRLRAHRVALSLSVGAIPAGMDVLHSCDNPPCCNPAHLTTGTHAQNMAERSARRRTAAGARNGRAKLTWEKVRQIRADYIPYKVGVLALSKRHGVNRHIVRDIVDGVTWRETEAHP